MGLSGMELPLLYVLPVRDRIANSIKEDQRIQDTLIPRRGRAAVFDEENHRVEVVKIVLVHLEATSL